MRWRWLLLPTLLAPAILQLACSASNGDAIPSEVRDAEAVDSSLVDPGGRDSSTPGEDSGPNPPKDGGPKDSSTDVAPDAQPTSADVRINEVYVDRAGGGDQSEFVEIRGAVGTPIDDLFLRAIDDDGVMTGEWPVAPAATTIGATGTWTLGGGTALGRIDKIVTAPAGWGLVSARGAVHLLRGTGKQLIDAVSWNTNADGGTVMGEGKPFVLAPSGTDSFGRKLPSFADTNDNKSDFCPMNRSAGAANTACK